LNFVFACRSCFDFVFTCFTFVSLGGGFGGVNDAGRHEVIFPWQAPPVCESQVPTTVAESFGTGVVGENSKSPLCQPSEVRLVGEVEDVDQPNVRVTGEEREHLLVVGRLVCLGREDADHAAGRVRTHLEVHVAELVGLGGLDSHLVQAHRQAAAGLLPDRVLRRPLNPS
jgi:hypothetical protein